MFAKCKEAEGGSFLLRLDFKVYLPILYIVILVTMVSLPYVLKTYDLSPIVAIGVGSIIFAHIVYTATFYRVWWKDEKVFRKVYGGGVISLNVNDIHEIRFEKSDLQTFISLSRPSQRIAIYGSDSEGGKFIDVSLKHFKMEDVQKLMKLIHEKRPDLEMPKGWG